MARPLLLLLGLAATHLRLATAAPVLEPPRLPAGYDGASPIVVPGPGLPSLESLGLTSAQLFDADYLASTGRLQGLGDVGRRILASAVAATKTPPSPPSSSPSTSSSSTSSSSSSSPASPLLDRRWVDSCLPGVPPDAHPFLACVNYLLTLGAECGAPATGVNMCYSNDRGGSAHIDGWATNGRARTASSCFHVAVGAYYGTEQDRCCTNVPMRCYTPWQAAAYGNGDLMVVVHG